VDDRLLNETEYKQFLKDCLALEQEEHWRNITELLAGTLQKLDDQIIYTQILESLLETRTTKVAELEHNLNTIEKELIELRCLVKTK
jgi:hypothetical protein